AGWRDIPVIVITALDLDAKDRDRLNSGVQSVLVKETFQPADLVERIRRLAQTRTAVSSGTKPASGPKSFTSKQTTAMHHAKDAARAARRFRGAGGEDGEKGCEMAAAERPDIILMDLEMPVVDGREATRRLKSNPQTRDIPLSLSPLMRSPASAKGRSPRGAT